MEYLYFHALEFVKVNNRLTERNVLEIVLMFGAKMGDLLSVFAVAPHAGAWVEIRMVLNQTNRQSSRSPRGSVG